MNWIALALLGLALMYFVVRKRPTSARVNHIKQKKQQAAALPEGEKAALAADVRELALAGYDRGSAAAKESGKSDQFSHEVGVLEAIQCVLANDTASRQNESVRMSLHMEAIPFNNLEPNMGRAAVAEYAVWKFFPVQADLPTLNAAMNLFVRRVFENAEKEPDPDEHIRRMIYSKKYNWQTLAIERAGSVAS